MTTDRRSQLLQDVFGRTDSPDWVKGRLLRTGEVASIFQVSRRTVTDWARSGKLRYVLTPGGQRRFPTAVVAEALAEMTGIAPDDETTRRT